MSKKEQAEKLRRNGFTLTEIAKEVGSSPALVSKWLRGLSLSDEEVFLLKTRQSENLKKAHNKSRLTNQMKRVFSERQALVSGKKSFEKNIKDHRFLIGLSIYLSQGSFSGNDIRLSSKDPEKIRIFLDWAVRFLRITQKDMIFSLITENQAIFIENAAHWHNLLGLASGMRISPIFQRNQTRNQKNGQDKGVFQISISRIALLRLIKVWKSLVLGYYFK